MYCTWLTICEAVKPTLDHEGALTEGMEGPLGAEKRCVITCGVQKSLLEVNRLELRLKSKKEIGKGKKGSGGSEEDRRACAKTLRDEMACDIRGRKKYLVQ